MGGVFGGEWGGGDVVEMDARRSVGFPQEGQNFLDWSLHNLLNGFWF